MPRAQVIETEIIELVWKHGETDAETEVIDEKSVSRVQAAFVDEESGEIEREDRKTRLQNTVLVAITL